MEIIKFDIDELKRKEDGFSFYILGRSYDLEENDVTKDYKKAFKIIKECADNGHIAAIYDLGANFYYNGVGTEQDMEKAKYYLNLACEAGLPRAIEKYNEYGFGTKKI